jgi:hypothetical protein
MHDASSDRASVPDATGGDVSADGSLGHDSDTVESGTGDAATMDVPSVDAAADSAGQADRTGDSADARDAADARITCDGGPTIVACGTSCVDISSSPQNCRACGHDCGAASACQAGVCQPVILYTGSSVPVFEVDTTGIYFRGADSLDSCPLTGCTLTPMRVAPGGGPLLLANGYVGYTTPVLPIGENYNICPTSNCTPGTSIFLIGNNRQVSVGGFITSPSGFFYAFKGPPGDVLSRCLMPAAAGCGSSGAIANFKTTPLVASDTFVYFTAALGDSGFEQLYSCPTDATNCVPTPINTSYLKLFAYQNDLYILLPVGGPMQTIGKCPGTGCGNGGVTPVVTTNYGMTEIAVDASGVYWVRGANIQACRLTGCVGGPVDVALNQGMPQSLRVSGGFVYWVNPTDNTIRRVAKPVL